MKTPIQYHHLLEDLKMDTLKADGAGVEDEKALETRLADVETKLKDLELNVARDLQTLRIQFKGQTDALAGNHPRRVPGKVRAEEEQRVQDVRTGKMAPYEEIRDLIAEYLKQIEGLRASLVK